MKAEVTTFIFILLLGNLLISGCTTNPVIPEPGPSITTTTGLTNEEYLKTHPPPPLNVQGTLNGDYIELNWDEPEPVTVPHLYSDTITQYNIYRRISSENKSFVTSVTERIFEDFDITGSGQYFYSVTAVHEGGVESPPSEEINVDISGSNDTGLSYEEYLRTHPPPPVNVQGILKGASVELSWDIPETVTSPHNYSDRITQYKIYRGTNSDDMSYLTSTTGLTFKDSTISGSPQYVYEITAVHEGGVESTPSDEIFVQVSMTISTSKVPGSN